MLVGNFPGLPEDGVTITLDRGIALAREDMLFLTWEHPMMSGAMDLILNSERGNAAFAVQRHEDLDSGQLLLEAIYRVECPAPKRLGVSRFMPQTLIRIVIDRDQQDLSHLEAAGFTELPQQATREEVAQLLNSHRRGIERMLKLANDKSQKRLPGLIAESAKRMIAHSAEELKRLAALRKVNPAVRQEELDQVKNDALELHGHIQAARLRLDALRVVLMA
jgi:ATP-dependent helicase HepA